MRSDKEHIINGGKLENLPGHGLGQVFFEILETYQDRIAVIDPVSKKSLTYKQFHENAIKIAIVLRQKGFLPGNVAGIFGDNTIYYAQVVFGVLYAGGILAPYNNGYISGELKHAISLSKPRVIFCSTKREPTLKAAASEFHFVRDIIHIEPTENEKLTVENLSRGVTRDDVANFQCSLIKDTINTVVFIMCSSGTTGLPKGVMLTHNNIIASLSGFELVDPITHTIALLPPFHVFGLMSKLFALYKGITMVVLEQFLPALFLQVIQDYKIETIGVVPPILSFMAKHPMVSRYDLSSLKNIHSGAAPVGRELEEALLKRFPHVEGVRQGYGLTESTLAVLRVPPEEQKRGSVGKVMPGVQVKVIDPETKMALGPNQPGEICLKGPLNMKGYIDNPEATAEAVDKDGWLHTGDIGYYDDQQWFYIVDRQKELIKYKGFQVPPAELEALLLDHPAVLDAAVVGIPDEVSGELPKAFIVKKSPVTEQDIRNFISSRVSDAKRLRGGVEFVESIPKNPSGKILRRILRDQIKNKKSKL